MPSTTVEDYLKHIHLQQQALPEGSLVAMGSLAEAVGVSPGSATAMVKALARAGQVHYEPRTGVRLAPAGMRTAVAVLRRHRLVELLLVRVLGLDWSEVHEEAEVLEHAVSDKVLGRIDALLGHPAVDPHGDPIPRPDGTMARSEAGSELASLADCRPGEAVIVVRVLDQDPAFLRMVDRHGLAPGSRVVVRRRDTAADAVEIAGTDGATMALGSAAAAKILVGPPPEPPAGSAPCA